MKLKKISIEGFRGVPKSLTISLDGKSLCLLGENGRGKTTIVDALEYLSRGEIESFKSADVQLNNAINLDHGPPAVITCEREGAPALRRVLNGPRPDDLEILGPTSLDRSVPPELPLLRHSTMTRFMYDTPFQKRQALLRLLGLDPLINFRAAVVAADRQARNAAEDAEVRLIEEKRVLTSALDGKGLIARAEELRQTAGLAKPITTEAEVRRLELKTTAAVQVRIDRMAVVDALERAVEGLRIDAIADWNSVSSDTEASAAEAIRTMLVAGQKVLATWPDATCPLCLTPADTSELAMALTERAVEYADLHELQKARAGLEEQAATEARVAKAVTDLLNAPPSDGWKNAETLKSLAADFSSHSEAAREALSQTKACPEMPGVTLDTIVTELRTAAIAPQESPEAAALAELVTLRDTHERVLGQASIAGAKRRAANAMARFHELTETHVDTAVQDAINRLGSVTADFYGRLIKNPIYSDLKLVPTSGKGGAGIAFSLVFDKRHTVSPPQRVVSESQLNALGLAFFLARLKVEATPWRTLVVDDIVNSFDADHRMGVASLLADEFGDWQILFFTHDSVFVGLSQAYFRGWRFHQIVAWSPSGGPVLDDADPLTRLAGRLKGGETASDLGGLARIALERRLSVPLERLCLPIRFSRRADHTARDYCEALAKGLADRGASLPAVPPILARMNAANYLTTLSAHDRPDQVSTEDLHHLVADLEALATAFVCPDCHRPVWDRKARTENSFHCRCSKLAV